MTAAEILEQTVVVLEERGWRQYRGPGMGVLPRSVCVGQALSIAASTDGFMWALTPEFKQALQAFYQEIGVEVNIGLWNDMPGRTKEEAVTTIRNAKRWLP